MIAADIMTPAPATISPDTPLDEVIRLLLHGRGAVPVVKDGAVVGIVGEADLFRRAELGSEPRPSSWLGLFVSDSARAAAFVRGHGRLARDVMTQPVVTVAEDTPVGEVAELLERRGISRVPVQRAGRLVGMVGASELLRALASRLAPLPARTEDDRQLREAVVAALELGDWLAGTADVTVVVEDGVAHLWGSAGAEAVHRALVVAVGEVPGVREVRDHLGPTDRFDPLDRPNWPVPAAP